MTRDHTWNLWIYALTSAISSFGGQFQFMAVTSLTYTSTRSLFLTTMQMAVSGLPYVLFVRWAGIEADRRDPIRLTALISALQAVATLGYLLSSHIALILCLNFIVSSLGVFARASRSSLIPQLAGHERLLEANARLATINGAAQLVAPALAGMIMVRINTEMAFVFNAVSYLFPALGLFLIRKIASSDNDHKLSVGHSDLTPAWQFIKTRPDFVLLMALYMAYTLGMWAVNALFFPYCWDILHGGTDDLGINISAYFGASLLTGLVIERWGSRLRSATLLPMGYLLGAVIWSGYTLNRSIPISHVLSAFDGVIFTFTAIRLDTWIQEAVPKSIRGRVTALARAAEQMVTVIGQLGGGVIAAYGGVLTGMRWSSGTTMGLVILIITVAYYRGANFSICRDSAVSAKHSD